MILPFRNNPVHISTKTCKFSLIPKGAVSVLSVSGRKVRGNPFHTDYLKGESGKMSASWAARFFVGLSIHDVPTHSMARIVRETRAFLRKAEFPEDATFIAQRGVYTHADKSVGVIEEDSVQVVIYSMGKPEKEFREMVEKLGEHFCRVLNQEKVIIDYQRNGVSKHVWECIA